MVKLFLVLALAMTVASQPLETVATSGGATLTTQLLNWAQFGLEAIMVYAKQFFGCNTSEHIFTILFFDKIGKCYCIFAFCINGTFFFNCF